MNENFKPLPADIMIDGEQWRIGKERIPHALVAEIKFRVIEKIDDTMNRRIIAEAGIREIMEKNDRAQNK